VGGTAEAAQPSSDKLQVTGSGYFSSTVQVANATNDGHALNRGTANGLYGRLGAANSWGAFTNIFAGLIKANGGIAATTITATGNVVVPNSTTSTHALNVGTGDGRYLIPACGSLYTTADSASFSPDITESVIGSWNARVFTGSISAVTNGIRITESARYKVEVGGVIRFVADVFASVDMTIRVMFVPDSGSDVVILGTTTVFTSNPLLGTPPEPCYSAINISTIDFRGSAAGKYEVRIVRSSGLVTYCELRSLTFNVYRIA
jgi:hypothetical protein